MLAAKAFTVNMQYVMGSLAPSKNLEKSNQDLVKLLGSKTVHCDVLVESGGRIIQLQKALEDSKDIYGTVVLIVGGNDCDDVNLMLSQYSDLIDAAHMATGGGGLVKSSSVCPRANDQIQTRIDASDAGLSQLCSDRSVEFIDNDDNFKARNGSINECLLLTDGVHMTTSGSYLLASNLNVDVIITQKPRQHVRHQSPKQHSETEHNQRQQVKESQTQQRPLN